MNLRLIFLLFIGPKYKVLATTMIRRSKYLCVAMAYFCPSIIFCHSIKDLFIFVHPI